MRRSVEVEYWVVDGDGRLVDPGPLTELSARVEPEFVEPLLEVKTAPCETTEEMRTELFERLGTVLRRADDLGYRLVPLATPLTAEEVSERESDRTRIQNLVVGDSFECVRHCAGTHVHVEQQPGRAVDQFNSLVALDPALALVNSSPYYGGRRLASGARSKLYRRLGYEGLPHQGRLWRYLDGTGQWTRRLERRYEEFVAAAVEAGADRRTVVANFDPESAVWTPVQLRGEFSTVEWRSPDTALPSQVLRLAGTLADVLERTATGTVRIEGEEGRLTDDGLVLPEFAAVIDHVDTAIEEGLDAASLRSYLDRMGFEVDAYDPITVEIGAGEAVTADTARDVRLRYAEALERDVRRHGGLD